MGSFGKCIAGSLGLNGKDEVRADRERGIGAKICSSSVPSGCMPRVRRGSVVIAYILDVIYGFVLLICRGLMYLIVWLPISLTGMSRGRQGILLTGLPGYALRPLVIAVDQPSPGAPCTSTASLLMNVART